MGSHLLSTAVNSGWGINLSIGKCNNKRFFELNTALTSGPIAGLSVGRVAGLLYGLLSGLIVWLLSGQFSGG